MNRHTTAQLREWSTPLILCGAAALIVLVAGSGSAVVASAASTMVVSAILVVGLYLFSGNSGVLAFGHVSFMAVGAYVGGLLTVPKIARPLVLANVPSTLRELSLPTGAAILAGGVTAAVVAAVVFLPLRRLSGLSLSIANLAFLLITYVITTNVRLSPSGGSITRIPVDQNARTMLPWLLIAIVGAFAYQRSTVGLRLRATREDEFAAQSAGIDIAWARHLAFVASAGLMGIGGALFGHVLGSFSGTDFYLAITVQLFAMLVVGGIGTLTGALTGVLVLSGLGFVVTQWEARAPVLGVVVPLPTGASGVVAALLMLVILIFRRDGLVGTREVVAWPRTRTRPEQTTPDRTTRSEADPDVAGMA